RPPPAGARLGPGRGDRGGVDGRGPRRRRRAGRGRRAGGVAARPGQHPATDGTGAGATDGADRAGGGGAGHRRRRGPTPPPRPPRARAARGLAPPLPGAHGPPPLGSLGALGPVLGVMVLGPVLPPPLCRAVAAPLARLFGFAARLARDNLLGNPRRTAATMGALAAGGVLAGGTGGLGACAA